MVNRVREIREARGWTRETLAQQARVSVRTLAAIEAGRGHNPRIETVGRIAQALNTNLVALYVFDAVA